MIKVLYESGVRNFELCALQIKDLGLDFKNEFNNQVRNGKGGKNRDIYISV